ncbi:hypothetical protein yc1106_08748 [Curvularia clavata]|uniref:RING-type domain-containing protein n=1 Tax=Curvularia clavata TaxID=95742 RepID=A0A9Q9DX20_CURCL|nr:hypothetical protein yc1106_08748 [Curvularia clavata]
MTLFAEKQVFKLLGLEAIQPSPLHTSQDCSICTKPLAMQPSPAQEEYSNSKLHAAVRITACSHIVGEECLDAWLDTGNSCPICRRELFDAKGEAVTQQDIERIIHSLSRYYDIYIVTASILRVIKRSGGKYILPKLIRSGARRDEETEEDDFGYSGSEVWETDEEMDFDEEEDEDEDMDFREDDDAYAELDQDNESEDEELEDCDDAEGQEEDEKNKTWVEKKNTCPMCRDRLFSNTTNDKNSNDITHEDVEHWLTLSEDRGMGDMDEAGIRGALGDEVDYEGSEEMQGNADENEMRIGRRSDRAEAMLGQGKTE